MIWNPIEEERRRLLDEVMGLQIPGMYGVPTLTVDGPQRIGGPPPAPLPPNPVAPVQPPPLADTPPPLPRTYDFGDEPEFTQPGALVEVNTRPGIRQGPPPSPPPSSPLPSSGDTEGAEEGGSSGWRKAALALMESLHNAGQAAEWYRQARGGQQYQPRYMEPGGLYENYRKREVAEQQRSLMERRQSATSPESLRLAVTFEGMPGVPQGTFVDYDETGAPVSAKITWEEAQKFGGNWLQLLAYQSDKIAKEEYWRAKADQARAKAQAEAGKLDRERGVAGAQAEAAARLYPELGEKALTAEDPFALGAQAKMVHELGRDVSRAEAQERLLGERERANLERFAGYQVGAGYRQERGQEFQRGAEARGAERTRRRESRARIDRYVKELQKKSIPEGRAAMQATQDLWDKLKEAYKGDFSRAFRTALMAHGRGPWGAGTPLSEWIVDQEGDERGRLAADFMTRLATLHGEESHRLFGASFTAGERAAADAQLGQGLGATPEKVDLFLERLKERLDADQRSLNTMLGPDELSTIRNRAQREDIGNLYGFDPGTLFPEGIVDQRVDVPDVEHRPVPLPPGAEYVAPAQRQPAQSGPQSKEQPAERVTGLPDDDATYTVTVTQRGEAPKRYTGVSRDDAMKALNMADPAKGISVTATPEVR